MSNKTVKRETGDRGEEIISNYLIENGFKILDRNYLRPWGEIDIIAQSLKDKVFHFVEVKSVYRNLESLDRYGDGGYSPADSVNREKRKRLSRVIQTYLLENGLGERDWQVDVALVYLDTESANYKIDMIEDIDLL